MEKILEQIETLITSLASEKKRTGHLDVATGGLATARDQVKAHLKKSAEKLKAENLKGVSDISASASESVSE